MSTIEERLLKIEHDAWLANYMANRNKATQDYNIMMGNIEDPEEEEEDAQ